MYMGATNDAVLTAIPSTNRAHSVWMVGGERRSERRRRIDDPRSELRPFPAQEVREPSGKERADDGTEQQRPDNPGFPECPDAQRLLDVGRGTPTTPVS
jgi:hypothetical protein